MKSDTATVYFSLDPYNAAFEERLDMRQYKTYSKPPGGMVFKEVDGRLVLKEILVSSPAARIPAWRTRGGRGYARLETHR